MGINNTIPNFWDWEWECKTVFPTQLGKELTKEYREKVGNGNSRSCLLWAHILCPLHNKQVHYHTINTITAHNPGSRGSTLNTEHYHYQAWVGIPVPNFFPILFSQFFPKLGWEHCISFSFPIPKFVNTTFTESALRPIQSVSRDVRLSVCLSVCGSHPRNHASRRIRDLWSKGVSLILAYL